MLKQLELVGFKSFADRTRFDFPAGITCVVGPNGSGKSNVVDAIRWVLGEQGVKTLRGKESVDVIFNGSGSRKPMNMAEVTLTFDNTRGLFAAIPVPEVAITRRLYRTGDSEYLINGQNSRLRDLRDILSGTGMGTQAYCVIEQGKVDALLSASPRDRRLLFEEAAGISRFRVRKLEAIRRLERVDQNMLRISDIVEQVRDRLETVRHQAGKARQYRDLAKRWESLRIGAAWFDQRQLCGAMETQESELDSVTHQREALVSESEAAETTLAQLDTKIRDAAARVREAEASAAGDRERIAGLESLIERENARLGELATQIRRFRTQRLELTLRDRDLIRQSDQLDAESQTASARRVAAQQKLSEQESKVGELESQIADQTSQLEQQRRDLTKQTQAAGRLDNQISVLEEKVGSTDAAWNQLDQQQTELDAQQEVLTNERAELDAENDRLERIAAAKNDDWSAVLTQRDSLRGEREELESQLDVQRQKRTAVTERIAVLEELEKRHEGLSPGVREVLQLSTGDVSSSDTTYGDSEYSKTTYSNSKTTYSGSMYSDTASDTAYVYQDPLFSPNSENSTTFHGNPFAQVRGLVADLFRVSVEAAALIETALGERSQYVVAAAGPALLAELVRDPFRFAGRVGFLWLNEDSSSNAMGNSAGNPTPDFAELTGLPGVVDRADRLIDTDAEYRTLAERLLGRTWIVESLKDAVDLLANYPQCKFITYTGEVLDVDGSVTVGPRNVSSGLISRRSELRELRASCALIGEKMVAIESQIQEIDQRIAAQEKRGQELAAIHRQAVEELSRHSHRITAANERAKQLERQRRALARDLHRAQQKRDEAVTSLQAASENRRQMETELERLENAVATRAGGIETLELRHERLAEATTEARIEVAKVDEAERNLESRRTQLDGSRADHQRSVATCVEQIELYQRRSEESERAILTAEMDLAITYRNREQTLSETDALIAEHDANLALRAELASSAHRYRSRMRRLEEKIRQCELVVEQTRMSLTTLRQRFQEDFDRDLSLVTEEDLALLEAPEDPTANVEEGMEESPNGTNPEVAANPEGTANVIDPEDIDPEDIDPEYSEKIAQDPDFSDPDAVDGRVDGRRHSESSGPMESESARMVGTNLESAESMEPVESELCLSERIALQRDQMQREIESLRRKLQLLGNVNQESLEELDSLEERHTGLDREYRDLLEAKAHLEKILERIDADSRRIFLETVETIRGHFQKLYRDLFGGGRADILLDADVDPLESGIEIVARPPGKQLRSLTLLSGGEKTMTCVALLLALFRSHPGPFCILDEVDAALDESNVGLFTDVLNEFQDRTQFIMISHSKRSMAVAATLHGVTMQEPGVSKRISVKFEDVTDDGELRAA